MLKNNKNYIFFLSIFLCTSLTAGPSWGGHLEPFRKMPFPSSNPGTEEKIELGKMLFFDRRLSGDGTMSCATCHIPNLGFGDGQAIGLSYPTTKNWRNTQTLINVAYQKFLFHDGRVESLEDQALFPIMSSFEVNQNLDFLEEEIRSVPEYRERFRTVFGDEDTSRERIAMAVGRAFSASRMCTRAVSIAASRDAPADSARERTATGPDPVWISSDPGSPSRAAVDVAASPCLARASRHGFPSSDSSRSESPQAEYPRREKTSAKAGAFSSRSNAPPPSTSTTPSASRESLSTMVASKRVLVRMSCRRSPARTSSTGPVDSRLYPTSGS